MDLGPTVQQLFDMTGQVAVVTGGSRDLGMDEACALVDLGAQVIVTSRDEESAVKAAQTLSARGKAPVMGMALDVGDPEAVKRVFGAVGDKFGKLDALVNNAGGAPRTNVVSLLERRLEDWEYVMRVNLTGTFLCLQAAANMMKERRSGSIVNISSIAGIVGRDHRIYEGMDMRPNIPDYSASKAGVMGLTREAAGALGPFGIRVNAILPGGFERSQPKEFIRRYADKTPLGRMGRDRYDLKGAVALLASPAGAYISGVCLPVDGGFSTYK